MKHDARDDGPSEFLVSAGDIVILWHFHEDLDLGERYVVELRCVEPDRWRVKSASRPKRFAESIVGRNLTADSTGTIVDRGPRGEANELDGLWIDDRIKII